MVESQGHQMQCQNCSALLSLLPPDAYRRGADVDPGTIAEPDRTVVALFVAADADGHYSCPKCGTGLVHPESRP
jgi:hypothetical protein